MNNSEKHFGNEANVTLHKNINLVPKATFSLSHDFIFLKTSPLLGRFLVSFNFQSAICGLQSAVCGLQSANIIHRVFSAVSVNPVTSKMNMSCTEKLFLPLVTSFNTVEE